MGMGFAEVPARAAGAGAVPRPGLLAAGSLHLLRPVELAHRLLPLRVALRLDPTYPFILKNIGDYALKVPIELNVPRGERIFSFAGRPEAYIDRDIIISYESTLGNLAQDILWAPQAHRPEHAQHFKFLPVTTRGVRVVNIAYGTEFWTVAEMRLRSQGRELPRSARMAGQRLAQRLGSATRFRQQLRHPLVHLGSHRARTSACRWNSRAAQRD